MNISELKGGSNPTKKANVSGVITELSDAREVNLKSGRTAKVATATLQDSSGTVKLTLWDADIEKVKKDSLVSVVNGYISEFRGEIQLNTGKFGRLEVSG